MGSVPHCLYFLNSVFCKNSAFESYGVKQSEGAICKLALAYLDQLCVPWRYQKLQCRASVDSRVLSSSVARQ